MNFIPIPNICRLNREFGFVEKVRRVMDECVLNSIYFELKIHMRIL